MANKEIKTIEVGGKTYAVGLFWQPVQDEKNYLKEVKISVQTVVTNANLYCLKKGAASQYGLGSTSYGHKSGMPSGASGIANALRDKSSALCVFRIKEGWWFITIRNNLILSEEDTVYTDEKDARDAFDSMLSIPDWGYKIAPAEWKIDETTEMSAADLLSRGQAVELRKIESNLKKNIIILLILGFVGWQYHLKQVEKAELERRLAEKKRQEQLKKLQPPPPPPPPPPAPYEALISPDDLAKKCTVLIVNSTATVPGWELQNSTCLEKQISSLWKRSYGTAGWIFEAQQFGVLHENMKLSANDSSYNNVLGVLAIPSVNHINSKPNMSKEEIQIKLNGIFHSLKLTGLKLENKKVTIKDPNNPSYSRDYPYTSFKFSDAAYRLPMDWVNMFKDIGGIEFESITWDNNKKQWNYVGKVYERTKEMEREEEEALKKALEEKNKAESQPETQNNTKQQNGANAQPVENVDVKNNEQNTNNQEGQS